MSSSTRPAKKKAKTGSAAAPGSRAPQKQGTKLTIERDSDGSMSAGLGGGTKTTGVQKSQLLSGFIECGDGENAQMTIPFSSKVVEQWMQFRNSGQAGDVTICCNVLQVASYLQDDVTVTAITWEIVGAVRNEMLQGLSKYQNFLKDCKWSSKSFKQMTQPLQKVLGDSELLHVASRFHLQELTAAPSFLLQACLRSLLAQSSTLDLSQLSELRSQAGYARGVRQVLTAAASMPFTSLILPVAVVPLQPLYISQAMPNVTSLQFRLHADQHENLPRSRSTSPFTMDVKFVCGVLERMPNVQAVTLPAMTSSVISTGAELVAKATNSLRSLASLSFDPILHASQFSSQLSADLIPARYILASLSNSTAVTKVCLPGEIAAASLQALLPAFASLQHLVIGTTATRSSSITDISQDLATGLQHGLSWVTALTALTHLDATHRVISAADSYRCGVKKACRIVFLEAVGQLLLPLQQLSVLRLKLEDGHLRRIGISFSLDDAGDSSSTLCSFNKLCARLDETLVTSRTMLDLVFPVAHILRSVASIRSLQLIGIRWGNAISRLSCLSLLTDLQIDLNGNHSSAFIEGLASALSTLQKLRKLRVGGFRDLLAPKLLGGSIAALPALEDFQCDDLVPSGSFLENPDSKIVAFAATLTRLTIRDRGSLSSSFLKQLTKLKHLHLVSERFSQRCFEEYGFLSSMHELEHLDLLVSVGRDDDVMQIHDLGHMIGGLRALTLLRIGFEFVDPDMCSFANHLSSLRNLQTLDVVLSDETRCQDEHDHDELMWAHEGEEECGSEDDDGSDDPDEQCAQQMEGYLKECWGYMEPLRAATLGLKVPIKELLWIDKMYID